MKEISENLKKFQKIISNNSTSRQEILSVLARVLGRDLVRNFEIKGKSLIIRESAALRSEVFLKKEKIIESFRSEGINIDELR